MNFQRCARVACAFGAVEGTNFCSVHSFQPYGEGHTSEIEADARALWAVRVLDRWKRSNRKHSVDIEQRGLTLSGRRNERTGENWVTYPYAPDEDAARIAAAEALVAEDPSLGDI